MALCFLLDEHLRGPLWQAIQHHNAGGIDVIDVLRVGDPPAPALGTADTDLLLWSEANGRILVSQDRKTMPGHLAAHFQAGHHIPGFFLLRPVWTISAVLAALILYDQACDPADLVDQVMDIP
jgi:hypothetical protein